MRTGCSSTVSSRSRAPARAESTWSSGAASSMLHRRGKPLRISSPQRTRCPRFYSLTVPQLMSILRLQAVAVIPIRIKNCTGHAVPVSTACTAHI